MNWLRCLLGHEVVFTEEDNRLLQQQAMIKAHREQFFQRMQESQRILDMYLGDRNFISSLNDIQRQGRVNR